MRPLQKLLDARMPVHRPLPLGGRRVTGRAFFIGRFQPFHRGHLATVKRILESNDEIIVGIGSAQYSHTGENPFTAGERYEMIKRALDAEGIHNYHIVPIPDTHVHSVWVSHVTSLVPRFDIVYTNSDLVVRLFREHGLKVSSPPLVDRERLSGTVVRHRMLTGGDWESLVPSVVAEYIKEINGTDRNPEHGKRAFVRPEPRGASRGSAHPVVVSKDRAVAFDIDLETTVIELARVGVRREFQEDWERDDPLQEPAEGREVDRLVPHHSTDRFVSSVAEPRLDLVEDFQRGPQRIPSVRVDETGIHAGLDQGLVRSGTTVVDRDPMVVVPEVASSNHGRDQPVSPCVGELPEHRDPEPRGRVQLSAALSADALRQIGAHELAERPAHVRETKARPLGDLNRSLRARDDGREDLLPLPAREDIRKPVEHVRGSRVQCLPRARCAATHDAAERSLPFPQPPAPRYVRRTGTRSEAIRCTRRTRNTTGTRPTIAERLANPIPMGPVAAAQRRSTARSDNAAIRRGF